MRDPAFFNMVKEGIPFVIVPVVLAVIAVALALVLPGPALWVLAALFLGVAAFMAFFFRDPHRRIPEEADIVLSAADGRVTRIEENEAGKLVSVFLSPFNVHINRIPITGKIAKVDYVVGKKSPATSDQASIVNERNSLTIVGEKMTVVCTQIAGILARRIVCWRKAGDEVEIGERFGLIKFGSRTDLLMPHEVEVLVSVGDKVVGGETIIAKLK
jgi:phosphatidylserine decarboxylase